MESRPTAAVVFAGGVRLLSGLRFFLSSSRVVLEFWIPVSSIGRQNSNTCPNGTAGQPRVFPVLLIQPIRPPMIFLMT